MRIVSHRGNLDGPGSECERERVDAALAAGFDVEVDVRHVFGKLMVGHDKPMYELPAQWLEPGLIDRFWFHAKDARSHNELGAKGGRVFMHANEPFAIVFPERLKWVHPTHNEVMYDRFTKQDAALDVLGYPRLSPSSLEGFPFALCTDWPNEWKAYMEGE